MELNTSMQLVTIAGHRIPYLLCGDDRQIWFQAKPLAELLDYENTAQWVRVNVRESHRQEYQQLVHAYGAAKVISYKMLSGSSSSMHPQTVFVDEPGMWTLMMRSTKPEAERIQEWVTAEVLPAIRKTGSYTIPQPQQQVPLNPLQLQQAANGMLDCYQRMMQMEMATDMDRLFWADCARNAVMSISTMPLQRSSSDGEERRMLLPVSDIVREATGRNGTKQELLRLGRLLAAEYRRRHDGNQPDEAERYVDGTTRMVKSYSMISDPWIKNFVVNSI